MIKHYLNNAVRNFLQDWGYTLINLLGLAVAIGSCLILGLYLGQELTYDRHNEAHSRIYRVVNQLDVNGATQNLAQTSQLLGVLLKLDYPQVEEFVRFQELSPTPFRNGDIALYQERVMLADPSVFKVFTHQIIYGDPDTALEAPTSIAISESLADVYFGSENPVGKTLETPNATYQVSLVFADLPGNSHMRYSALISLNSLSPVSIEGIDSEEGQNSLADTNMFTYLLFFPGFDANSFKEMAASFWKRHMEPAFPVGTTYDHYLEPLASIHLHSTTTGDLPRGDIFFIDVLVAIFFFLIGVACINYVNLATARGSKRAKEVTVRRIFGAARGTLIIQFLGESTFIAILAVPLAVVIADLAVSLLPLSSFIGIGISTEQIYDLSTITFVIVGTLIVGLLSGIFPALYLSKLAPVTGARTSYTSSKSVVVARYVLISIQFAISIGTIGCALSMASQVSYFYNTPLGFEKKNKVVLRIRDRGMTEQIAAVRDLMKQHPQILGVTTSNAVPGGDFTRVTGQAEDANGALEERVFNAYRVGEEYFEVMGMEVVEGRLFDSSSADGIVVNERTVAYMGWDNALGKRILDLPVVAVVKDFHFASLSRELEPLFMTYDSQARRSNYITVSIAGQGIEESIAHIESVWRLFDQKNPFQYYFLEDALNQLYSDGQRSTTLAGGFALLCIFISILGLVGLLGFSTEQRATEISIRKILGASYLQLVYMLLRNVTVIVLASAAVASLIGYVLVSQWLQSFANHVNLNPLYFLFSAATCLALTLITTTIQTRRILMSSPVDYLAYE